MKFRLLRLNEIPDCCAVCGWYRIDESSACTQGAKCIDDFCYEVEEFGVCEAFQRVETWSEQGDGVLWKPDCADITCVGCEYMERD